MNTDKTVTVMLGIVILSLAGVIAIVVLALNTQDGVSTLLITSILAFLTPTIAALVAAAAAHQAKEQGKVNQSIIQDAFLTQTEQAKVDQAATQDAIRKS